VSSKLCKYPYDLPTTHPRVPGPVAATLDSPSGLVVAAPAALRVLQTRPPLPLCKSCHACEPRCSPCLLGRWHVASVTRTACAARSTFCLPYPLLHPEPYLRTFSSLFAVRRVLYFRPIATSLTAGSDPPPFFHTPLSHPRHTHAFPATRHHHHHLPGHHRSRPLRYPVPRALSRYISPRALYMRSSHCST
jgi:hypothetical protein